MCIAILKPKDKILDREILKNCYDSNKDGCGFAYCDKSTVFIQKFMEFEDFYTEYKKVENKSNMLIHFRIATHGKVELDNCHPFVLNERMALIHNGIISGYGDKNTKSDTRDFIDRVIGNISWKMWKNPSYRELVSKAIGYSKLVILDKTGEYFIVNEDNGEWVDGVWFSNGSWKPKKVYTTYTASNSTSNKISSTKIKQWDMYGEQSYDDWYDEYYGIGRNTTTPPSTTKIADDLENEQYNVIYKCKKCGKIVVLDEELEPLCDVCKAQDDDLEEIGCEVGGNTYYYEENKYVLQS